MNAINTKYSAQQTPEEKNQRMNRKKVIGTIFFYILFGETSKSIYHIVCDQKNMLVVLPLVWRR